MFILGHAGITVGVVRVVDRKADARWIAVLSLLPDLVDKPIQFLVPTFANGWSRSIAHSLTGFVVFALVALAWRRGRAGAALLAYGMHIVLDRMWLPDVQHILFWPFQGFWLAPKTEFYEHWWFRFGDPWNTAGEVLGFTILATLAYRGRLWRNENRRDFVASGILRTGPLAPGGSSALAEAPTRSGEP